MKIAASETGQTLLGAGGACLTKRRTTRNTYGQSSFSVLLADRESQVPSDGALYQSFVIDPVMRCDLY